MHVIGIDPAPSKPTVAFDGAEFHVVQPADLRTWVEERLAPEGRTLVAWDAPLAFDPSHSFYTRPVDKQLAHAGRDEPAVNTAPFGNLSHWSITCHVTGHPFGDPPAGLRLVDAMPDAPTGPMLIEVHPAFALLQWWRRADKTAHVPAYKASGRKRRLHAVMQLLDVVGPELRGLGRLRTALEGRVAGPDDLLDAAVAHEVAMRFAERTTTTVGNVRSGFIVLPHPLE